VKVGETIALVGPSGGGKSTFLRCLKRADSFDAGKVQIAGVGCSAHRAGRAAAARAAGAGGDGVPVVEPVSAPHRSANVSLAPIHVRRSARGRGARAAELLRAGPAWPIGGTRDPPSCPAGSSSGGHRRALAMDPECCSSTEPTSALDPQMRGEVLGVLRDLARTGMTMLVVTHEMAFARAAASRVWVFRRRPAVEDGPPAQVCDSPRSDRARAFFAPGDRHSYPSPDGRSASKVPTLAPAPTLETAAKKIIFFSARCPSRPGPPPGCPDQPDLPERLEDDGARHLALTDAPVGETIGTSTTRNPARKAR